MAAQPARPAWLRRPGALVAAAFLLSACSARPPAEDAARRAPIGSGVHVDVALDSHVTQAPVSGRLIVILTRREPRARFLEPDPVHPRSTWIVGTDVRDFRPGSDVELPADAASAPAALGKARSGMYRMQAILDVNGTYAYSGMSDGDLSSSIEAASLAPGDRRTIHLTLSQRYADAGRVDTDQVKGVAFVSPSLSRFAGHPVTMRAGIILPPSYDSQPQRRYPTVYVLPAFGSDYHKAWTAADRGILGWHEGILARERDSGKEMIVAVLDLSCSRGSHEFADSANDGPWGRALTSEFIPYLEREFRMDARPQARLLTGHSSGAWSALWLQVNYPAYFGGAWSTAPDPVDFRDFAGADLTRTPPDNMYRDARGNRRAFVSGPNGGGRAVEDYIRQGDALGGLSQFASFDAVFSPRGRDGRPMRLFDHRTGAIDPAVARYWEEHYDISSLLARTWPAVGPRLHGKLHVVVGAQDTFGLDNPVALLARRLKQLGSDAEVEIVPGGTHFNLYGHGLFERFWGQMYAAAQG